MARAGPLDRIGEVVRTAQDGHRAGGRGHDRLQRIGVQKAHRAHPVGRIFQSSHQVGADGTGADDQRGDGHGAVAGQAATDRQHHRSRQAQVYGGEQPQPQGELKRVHVEEGGHADDQHRGQGDHAKHVHGGVKQRALQAAVRGPPGVQHHQHHQREADRDPAGRRLVAHRAVAQRRRARGQIQNDHVDKEAQPLPHPCVERAEDEPLRQRLQ